MNSTALVFSVRVAINDPDLAMTARYTVHASDSLDASRQATAAAHAEFGSGSLGLANGWSTDSLRML